VRSRHAATRCDRGRSQPTTWAHSGSPENGKKTPPNRNIGVMIPVKRMLNCSMLLVTAVYAIPRTANVSAPIAKTGGSRSAHGDSTSPKQAITIRKTTP
jgi:hypothetical protein